MFGWLKSKEKPVVSEVPVLDGHEVDEIVVNVISSIDPRGKPLATLRVEGRTLTITVLGERILENLAHNMNFTLSRGYRELVEDRIREDIIDDIRRGIDND